MPKRAWYRLVAPLIAVVLSFALPTPARAQYHWPEAQPQNAPIRFITKSNNRLIGGRVAGRVVEVYVSNDDGATWTLNGSVATAPDAMTQYLDPCLLSDGGPVIYCACRAQFLEPPGAVHPGAYNGYQIVISTSFDAGNTWKYDSIVDSSTIPPERIGANDQNGNPFWIDYYMGAPCLFFSGDGTVQCYYDSAPAYTATTKKYGGQYVMMRAKLKSAFKSDWTLYSAVASRPAILTDYAGDGSSSVVSLGGADLMLVCEGGDPKNSLRAPADQLSCVFSIFSHDYGRTWDYNGRTPICQPPSLLDPAKQANAYCPIATRFGGGPVGVAFCTDDFRAQRNIRAGLPDVLYAHVKFIRTLDTFQKWGALEIVDDNHFSGDRSLSKPGWDRMYCPGLYELSPNVLLCSIDNFPKSQQKFIHR